MFAPGKVSASRGRHSGNIRRGMQRCFSEPDDCAARGCDDTPIAKLLSEIFGRSRAPGTGNFLADHPFGIEFCAKSIGIAALAHADGCHHVDHHLAFRRVAVNLIEQQTLAERVIAAEELQAHLTLIRGLWPRRRIEIMRAAAGRRKPRFFGIATTRLICALISKAPTL